MAIENNFYTDIHSVMCRNCFAESDRYHTQKEAIKQWNTRKPMQEIVERLEDDIEENPEASLGNYRAGLYKAIEIVKEVRWIK